MPKPNIIKNSGKRWSDEEDTQLLQEVQEEKSYENIAQIHQRTESAVRSRISIKAVNDYKSGVDLETIYQRYKMSEKSFQEAFEYVSKKSAEKAKAETKKTQKEESKNESVKNELVEDSKEKSIDLIPLFQQNISKKE
jgi:cell division protein FtsI/penicillin-binding protein 2